jgi:hypothetical protein
MRQTVNQFLKATLEGIRYANYLWVRIPGKYTRNMDSSCS